MNYYNENNPKAAAWLQVLIDEGTIPGGKIDARSIADVRAADLRGFSQCHFFAGIGGWAEALRLAGYVTSDRIVWTASLPCQPFSIAGSGRGTDDERHLWPVFAELVRAGQPAIVFGEQVASPAGRKWFAGISADLEGMAYQVAGADISTAGAPHIRQRLYWFACRLGYADRKGWIARRITSAPAGFRNSAITDGGIGVGLPDSQHAGFKGWLQWRADSEWENLYGHAGCGSSIGFWDEFDLLPFKDGKIRRIEPGTFPLVDGFPARVAVLHGLGNAICPQLAAQFIRSASEAWIDYAAG